MVSESDTSKSAPYVVVARRYRPQSFQELVGQNQVAKALGNAIETNRVGHAYLFTGARGVGKTSSARIFSKCLNCELGPTLKPCDQCDICQAISAGDDVDVLEIDGASNRGIDEIRQLRTFVTVRPSRSRYKIYIIDEVHMLTKEAFNALLKTLEEPPGHVKFIFCTTNPEKIPITVLSRCQRFDFAPVISSEIKDRLQYIVKQEGAEADDDALKLLARRAGGSMRDSQSLLEQLLAFSSGRITVEAVHQMLGTAPGGRVETLVQAMVESSAGKALDEIHLSVTEGADVSQILEQLAGYYRDLMVLSVGGGEETLLQLSPDEMGNASAWAAQLGTTRILATMQIFDWALARMRQSTHTRSLLELAIVQACGLNDLKPLAAVIDSAARIESGQPKPAISKTSASNSHAAPSEKKNDRLINHDSPSAVPAPADSRSQPETAPLVPIKATNPTDQPSQDSAPVQQTASTSVTTTSSPASEPVATESSPMVPQLAEGNAPAAQLETTTIAETPGQSSSVSNANASQVAASQAADLTAADAQASEVISNGSPAELVGLYRNALDQLDGMVRDLAMNFTKLQAISDSHWKVYLENEYLAELCTRQDRKSAIENAILTSAGRQIRIDFGVLASQPIQTHTTQAARQKNKSQKLRELQSDPFVAKLIEVFKAELTDVLPPRPRKNEK